MSEQEQLLGQDVIEKICNKHDIEFVDVNTEDGMRSVMKGQGCTEDYARESYDNRSVCAGKTMWLGIYKDEERRLAAFFHEFGHIKGGHTPRYKEKWHEIMKTKHHSETYA